MQVSILDKSYLTNLYVYGHLPLNSKKTLFLGNQFDLKEFHNVVLKNGAVPLDILEEIVESYINETLAKSENQKITGTKINT